MKLTEWVKYSLYFFSYFLVYLSYPIVFIVQFFIGGDNPNASQEAIGDTVFYIFTVVVTILGAIVLNILFKGFTGLEKNNKYSWLIFLSHIVLIPFTAFLQTI